jgi:sugar/nucleoside kinase (ribokinase family)
MNGSTLNGAQDLGGMMGFGPVEREPNEPVFHADWERRAFALTVAMGAAGLWNIDQSRHARESLHPARYLASTYYQIWLEGLVRLLAEADYVVANETEFDLYADLLELTGESREDRMASFARQTGRCLVVTLGAEGAIAARGSELVRVSAPEIVPVDTVGAGDTFCGYLAAALEAGLELEEAMVRATVAGSLACLKSGAQPAIPTAAEVDEAMAG